MQGQIGPLLLSCQLLAAWFLGGHEDRHLGQRERQKAQVLQQPTPYWQGIWGRVGNPLVMDAAAVGRTEKEDREQRIDQEDVFYRMVFFLATITRGLFNR